MTTLLQPISKCYAALPYKLVTFERQAVTAVAVMQLSRLLQSEELRVSKFQRYTISMPFIYWIYSSGMMADRNIGIPSTVLLEELYTYCFRSTVYDIWNFNYRHSMVFNNTNNINNTGMQAFLL